VSWTSRGTRTPVLPPTATTGARKTTATVCLSGTLVEKMHACAAAGFDGIELFEPDLVVAPESPEEIRSLADRLGLDLVLYQPFRDFEGVDDRLLAANLRRAEAKFALMQRLRMETILVCSNVGTATLADDHVAVDQLRRLGDLGARYGVRIAYEALAWGRFVDDYRHAWRIVEQVDHDQVGVCLDSFHILSRGHDPAGIEEIPGDKIFFLQLADAPLLTMDVLSWSRHHRLFPGEGDFDLPQFVAHVMRTGYAGPLSLEVFNDIFRQTDVTRTAVHAMRSLSFLEDQAAQLLGPRSTLTTLTPLDEPAGVDFVEVKAENTDPVEIVLSQLGFTFGGHHRTKPVRLWQQGNARVVLNEQQARDRVPTIAAIGFEVSEPGQSAQRAAQLAAPPVFRRTSAQEHELRAVAAPDGTEIFWAEAGLAAPLWAAEFDEGRPPAADGLITRIDHTNLSHPWHRFDEAVLFYGSVLALQPQPTVEVAGPVGLVRSQVMRTRGGEVRLVLNVAPLLESDRDEPQPQHVAFACSDAFAAARCARERGLDFLPVPDNYYADLQARFGLSDPELEALADLDLLYDRDDDGEFVHFYTRTYGNVFFEVVERRASYDGYGAANAPVRLAAQHSSAKLRVRGGSR
jgi:4-hydroxyphenylpyruvate dioxygenase